MTDFKIKDCFFSKRLTKEDDAKNRLKRLKYLDEKGFKYKIFNNGNHVRINNCVDWYPSTAYWKSLDKTKNGYGFHPLLEFLENYRPIEIKEVNATPEEKEEFYRMTEETTEYRAGPQFKVGDRVLVEAEILQDLADDSSTEGDNTILLRIGNGIRIWQPRTAIHSHAPKEPMIDYGDYSFAGRTEKNGTLVITKHHKEECRFQVGDHVWIWGRLAKGVVVNIDKMHDFMQIPNAIGVETGGVIRYFRQDDLRVCKEVVAEPAASGKVVRFSVKEKRDILNAVYYCKALLEIPSLLKERELTKTEKYTFESLDELEQKLMGAE